MTSSPTPVVKRSKLADFVARDLRTWIVSGALKEGDQLPKLEKLAERFEVSPAVIREAVRILETEDLLAIQRGATGGVVVRTPTQEVVTRSVGLFLQFQKVTVDDLLTARLSMEPFAVVRLATMPTQQTIEELQVLVTQADAAVQDPMAFAAATTAFHQALVTLSGNKTLSVVHAAVLDIAEVESISFTEQWARSSLALRQKIAKSYRRLLKLIKAGDATGAEQHWIKHLENSRKTLLSIRAGMPVVDLLAKPGSALPIIDLGKRSPGAAAEASRKRAPAAVPAPATSRVRRRS